MAASLLLASRALPLLPSPLSPLPLIILLFVVVLSAIPPPSVLGIACGSAVVGFYIHSFWGLAWLSAWTTCAVAAALSDEDKAEAADVH